MGIESYLPTAPTTHIQCPSCLRLPLERYRGDQAGGAGALQAGGDEGQPLRSRIFQPVWGGRENYCWKCLRGTHNQHKHPQLTSESSHQTLRDPPPRLKPRHHRGAKTEDPIQGKWGVSDRICSQNPPALGWKSTCTLSPQPLINFSTSTTLTRSAQPRID